MQRRDVQRKGTVHNARYVMKQNTRGDHFYGPIWLLLVAVITLHLVWPLSLRAQADAQTRQDATFILNAAKDVMNKARYCALITSDGSGYPHVRIMDPFSPDEGLIVWFGTNRHSRKVQGPFSAPGHRVTADRAIGLGSVNAAAAVDTLATGQAARNGTETIERFKKRRSGSVSSKRA